MITKIPNLVWKDSINASPLFSLVSDLLWSSVKYSANNGETMTFMAIRMPLMSNFETVRDYIK